MGLIKNSEANFLYPTSRTFPYVRICGDICEFELELNYEKFVCSLAYRK